MKTNDIKLIESYLKDGKCKEALDLLGEYLNNNNSLAHYFALSIYSGIYDKNFRNEDEYLRCLKSLIKSQAHDDIVISEKLVELLTHLAVSNKHDKLINVSLILLPERFSKKFDSVLEENK